MRTDFNACHKIEFSFVLQVMSVCPLFSVRQCDVKANGVISLRDYLGRGKLHSVNVFLPKDGTGSD